MTYFEMLDRVQFRCDQKPLIGFGVTLYTDYDGNELKIGDLVDFNDGNGNEPMRGILVLILDQGICLLSDKYWMQIHIHYYVDNLFTLVDRREKTELNLV